MNQSLHCGIILNELITNAFKYAFPKGKGEITISLTKAEDKVVFLFKDNGVGFDVNALQQESFGLSFVEALVEDELNGSIEIDSLDGVEVLVRFGSDTK